MKKYPSQLRSKLEFKLESNLSFAKHRKLSSECLVLRSVEYDVEWYINVDKFLVGQGLSTWLAESVIINKLSTFINQATLYYRPPIFTQECFYCQAQLQLQPT